MNTIPNNTTVPQQESETQVSQTQVLQTQVSQPDLSRGEFIRSLGMSSAALMAFYCLGTLSSCKGSDPAPAPVVITPPPPGGGSTNTGVTGNASASAGAIDFTVDLANTNFTTLKTVGNFVNVGDLIVFNAAGVYNAVSRTCTHASGNLSFRPATNDLVCSIHGGLFNTNGSVKQSPPTMSVKAYATLLTGDKLQVKA